MLMRNESMRNKRPSVPAYAAPSLSHRFNWPTVGRKKRSGGGGAKTKNARANTAKIKKSADEKSWAHIRKMLNEKYLLQGFRIFFN